MAFDLVLTGGTVVTASDTFAADVSVRNGKIAALGFSLDSPGARVIDCAGKLVMPGGIDVHTHMEMPFGGTVSKDTFETGTIAAACGGTTTIVDFCIQAKGQSLREALDGWHAKADGKACIDYAFHVAVSDMTDAVLAEMPSIIADGCPSFKLFMVYDGLRVSDGVFVQALEAARDNGGLVCVHAENNDVVVANISRLLAQGKTAPVYHALSRPPLAEGEATGRACKLARITGGPLYVVHLSCEDALREVERARAEGAAVMAETCPQYLYLSIDNYEEPDFAGAKYVMSPPLRPRENQAPLWEGLRKNTLQAVATDHCPFDFKGQKDMGRDSFAKIPNGAPGVETRMALLYKAVAQGRISLNRMVEIASTNPAKIMGMYPSKGLIAPGADADICVFDPQKSGTITHERLHENVDYTPFEGIEVSGWPVLTLSRGRIVAENGEWVGEKGKGAFVRRSAPRLL